MVDFKQEPTLEEMLEECIHARSKYREHVVSRLDDALVALNRGHSVPKDPHAPSLWVLTKDGITRRFSG
tara:strand:- start:8393 stop:8599 length:207 start_codon:yes stop_codon:yes gene_type:complete